MNVPQHPEVRVRLLWPIDWSDTGPDDDGVMCTNSGCILTGTTGKLIGLSHIQDEGVSVPELLVVWDVAILQRSRRAGTVIVRWWEYACPLNAVVLDEITASEDTP